LLFTRPAISSAVRALPLRCEPVALAGVIRAAGARVWFAPAERVMHKNPTPSSGMRVWFPQTSELIRDRKLRSLSAQVFVA
jgi:hypothetical protein